MGPCGRRLCTPDVNHSLSSRNTRLAFDVRKRRWAPQTTRGTPKGIQKPSIDEAKLNDLRLSSSVFLYAGSMNLLAVHSKGTQAFHEFFKNGKKMKNVERSLYTSGQACLAHTHKKKGCENERHDCVCFSRIAMGAPNDFRRC